MVTIEQIKNYKICNVIEVTLEGILLELHLNLKYLDSKKSISISASEEGEILLFSIVNYWKDKNNIRWCYKKYDTDLDISIIDVKES